MGRRPICAARGKKEKCIASLRRGTAKMGGPLWAVEPEMSSHQTLRLIIDLPSHLHPAVNLCYHQYHDDNRLDDNSIIMIR